MSEPLTREMPVRAALLRRHFDADDDTTVEPTVRAPRRVVLEGPDTTPPPVEPGRPALRLGGVARTVLALINRGAREDSRVVGITPTGAEFPLADIELREGD